MRVRFAHIFFVLFTFPLLFVAQNKETKTGAGRLEIIGKWYSYSSLDSTKKEYCEFKPDGIFVEYKNVIVKDRDTKYVLYGNELSMANGKEKDKIIMKFKVSKESYGLFLRMTSLNTKNSGDAVMWVKLLPWKS